MMAFGAMAHSLSSPFAAMPGKVAVVASDDFRHKQRPYVIA